MRPVLPWIAAYLAILVVWALVVVQRIGPTLWKGRSLVALNIALVLVSTIVVLGRGGTSADAQGGVAWCCFPSAIFVFDLVLIAIAFVVRRKWLLLRISPADTATILERCAKQTRASAVRDDDGYALQCGDAEMTVTIRPTMIGLVGIRFTGGADSRKAALVRGLFGKQFHSSFPTPRIRA